MLQAFVRRVTGRGSDEAPAVGGGTSPVHRPHQGNHCPECGSAQWHVGRVTAECGVCEHVIPLACSGKVGARAPVYRSARIANGKGSIRLPSRLSLL